MVTSPDRSRPKRQLGPTEIVCKAGKEAEISWRKADGSWRERGRSKGRAMVSPIPQRVRTRSLCGSPVIKAGCFSGWRTERG